MKIVNPTPITPGEMTNMWVANLRIDFPTENPYPFPIPQANGRLSATLLPYDGTHLLATGVKPLFIQKLNERLASDTTFNTVVTSLVAEAKRQANKILEVKNISVFAPDPAKAVRAMVNFADGSFFTIHDCFTLASTDTTFGGVFMSTMNEVARQAGLTVA